MQINIECIFCLKLTDVGVLSYSAKGVLAKTKEIKTKLDDAVS